MLPHCHLGKVRGDVFHGPHLVPTTLDDSNIYVNEWYVLLEKFWSVGRVTAGADLGGEGGYSPLFPLLNSE